MALAALARRYRDGKLVLKVLISKHANECGLDIDDSGPYAERDEIVVPLEKFLKVVSDGLDLLYQCALAHLAWEAYQKYLVHKDVRIQAAAGAEQDRRRAAHHSH